MLCKWFDENSFTTESTASASISAIEGRNSLIDRIRYYAGNHQPRRPILLIKAQSLFTVNGHTGFPLDLRRPQSPASE